MKNLTTLLMVYLILWLVSCKHSKPLAQPKVEVPAPNSQISKDTICEELANHIKAHWSYDNESRLYKYDITEYPKSLSGRYRNCFIQMDTTACIALLGEPSLRTNGYLFYFMNNLCWDSPIHDGCLWYKIDYYRGTGNIKDLGKGTVSWIP